ncbi:hypothetical protein CSB45_00945 [candidate division KSB3 bacterium]|uniref:Bro-N domain-containing protein n=1 Tax=candidate division KSB3 bacterium TaxID=2044937 RepID=A0A2G6EBB0_9BACT|nr:MAG: hypothetical protein CSB45_00945 [candidate division KSB3 bacterium]
MNDQNAVVPFQFNDQQVRTVVRDGAPWFVAKDVCGVLEINNSRKAVSGLDDDEKGVTKSDTPGGEQELSVLSESGLYTLIVRSNKPQAKPFRRWVTHEVLPSIRKNGFYGSLSKEGMKTLVTDVAAEVVEILQTRQQKGPFVDTTGVKEFLGWLDHDLKGDRFTRKGDLYDVYKTWCVEHGIKADSSAHFFLRLYRAVPSLKGARIQVDGKRTPVVVGISVNREQDEAGKAVLG